MREVKTKKYKGSLLLKFAVLCFAAFVIYSLINQQIQIGQKKEELEAIQTELTVQEIKNDELKHNLDEEPDLKDYAEKAARKELDYARPEERIFVNVGGE